LIRVNDILGPAPDNSQAMRRTIMELNAIKLGLATSIVFAVIWTVCSLLILSVPLGMMQVRGGMAHSAADQMPMLLSWGGFATGLISWTIVAGLVVWGIAAVYNRLIR
jgi:hypothetical protein